MARAMTREYAERTSSKATNTLIFGGVRWLAVVGSVSVAMRHLTGASGPAHPSYGSSSPRSNGPKYVPGRFCVANFLELRKVEVQLRRIPLPRRGVTRARRRAGVPKYGSPASLPHPLARGRRGFT